MNDEEIVIRQQLIPRKIREIRKLIRLVAFMIGMIAMSAIVIFGYDAVIEFTVFNITIIILGFITAALTIAAVLTLLSRYLVKKAIQEEMGVTTDEWQG